MFTLKKINHIWRRSGVSRKFISVFCLLFLLIMIFTGTVYVSMLEIRKAEKNIRDSTMVVNNVLKMDRGMERARRFLASFFLFKQNLGLERSYQKYGRLASEQINDVVSTGKELEHLFNSSVKEIFSKSDRVHIQLYLSSAERFSETSASAIRLAGELIHPEHGLETQLQHITSSIQEALQKHHDLDDLYMEGYTAYQKYLLSRKRPLMQSSFNSQNLLRATILKNSVLTDGEKETVSSLLDSWSLKSRQILEVDAKFAGKMHDFYLLEEMVTPVSDTMVANAKKKMEDTQAHIDQVYLTVTITMLTIGGVGFLIMLFMTRLLHNSITGNILKLSKAARELGQGNLSARAEVDSLDEIGQLSDIFNNMAVRLDGMVKNLEDTVSKRTAELTISEKRFRNLLNALPRIAVQGVDRQGNIIYWNRTSETMFGYEQSEVVEKNLQELLTPAPLEEEMNRTVTNWFKNNIAIAPAEVDLCHKDGSRVSVYCSHVMLTDGRGEKTLYSIIIDLAELRLAQKKEERSETFYRQLFDYSSNGVAVYDAIDDGKDFIFKDFNLAGEKIEGIGKDELIGRRVTEAFPGIEKLGLLEVFTRVWKTGVPAHHPVSWYEDNRLKGWRENKVFRLPSGEIVAIYEDITKQKQIEEEKKRIELRTLQTKRMEGLGLLAGGVAHDLNNILSAIIAYPEIILKKLPKNDDMRPLIEAILDSGQRAALVVADLLTVARGVAQAMVGKDLNQLVGEYFSSPEFLQLQSLYPHIRYQRQLVDEPLHISCSSVHIQKCIMNLINNAAEAAEPAGTISITTTTMIPDQNLANEQGVKRVLHAVLSITDTGSGIPKDKLEHIFEPFYTTKEAGRSGTGLGLAVVWSTMNEHGGTVTVTSNAKGSEFKLFFPVTEESIDGETVQNNEVERGNGETILVVDDEAALRDIASRILETLGYNVICMSSGEDAVNYLKSNLADLLILDMLMEPGINGRQTYEQITKLHPGQKAILVSGFVKNNDVEETLRLGAGAFVKKPYSMAELGQAVKQILRG